MNLVNLTPHPIVVAPSGDINAPDTITIPPSGVVARVTATTTTVGMVGNIPVRAVTYGDVTGVPAPQPGTVYIVSGLVRAALGAARPDVVSPDTGGAIRDGQGQILAVTGFIGVSPQ